MSQCNCWENRNWCKKENAISCHTSLLYVPWCLCFCVYCIFQRQSSFYAFSVPIRVQLISQISNRDLQRYKNNEYVFKYFMEPILIERMPTFSQQFVLLSDVVHWVLQLWQICWHKTISQNKNQTPLPNSTTSHLRVSALYFNTHNRDITLTSPCWI